MADNAARLLNHSALVPESSHVGIATELRRKFDASRQARIAEQQDRPVICDTLAKLKERLSDDPEGLALVAQALGMAKKMHEALWNRSNYLDAICSRGVAALETGYPPQPAIVEMTKMAMYRVHKTSLVRFS